METKTLLLCNLLNCDRLDIDYLVNLIDKNNMDLNELFYLPHLNINSVLYRALDNIIHDFFNTFENDIEEIIDMGHLFLNEYLEFNEVYTIYTNSIDNHIVFYDDNLRLLFENSEYRV